MQQRPSIQTNFIQLVCVLAAGAALASQFSCASSPRITVESLNNWPDVAHSASPSPTMPTVGTATVRAHDATFVHSLPDWSDRNLHDREYILAGADHRPAFWISYVAFDLSALKPEMFGIGTVERGPGAEQPHCSNPELTVKMTMEPLTDPPLQGRDGRSELRVFRAMEAMPVEAITWNNQPLVIDNVYGVGLIDRNEQAVDEFDVTELICESLEQGRGELLLAIIPADPSVDLRRRWISRSEYGQERVPSLIIESGLESADGGYAPEVYDSGPHRHPVYP